MNKIDNKRNVTQVQTITMFVAIYADYMQY